MSRTVELMAVIIHVFNRVAGGIYTWDRRGRDRIVIGCTTTYAISGYHH